MDIKKTTDTLAYILAMEDYLKYSKSTGVVDGNIADSSLTKYLVSRDSSLAMQGTGNLSVLYRSYIGDQKLSMKIDSLKTMQTDFMTNYLSHDKAIPSDRFRIIGTTPDTIKYEVPWPAFRTYFTASGENQQQ